MVSSLPEFRLNELKRLNDDDQHDIDQDEGARDGEDEEHHTGRQGGFADRSKLEFVEDHGEASLEWGDDSVEFQHVVVQDHVENLDEGEENQTEDGQETG